MPTNNVTKKTTQCIWRKLQNVTENYKSKLG